MIYKPPQEWYFQKGTSVPFFLQLTTSSSYKMHDIFESLKFIEFNIKDHNPSLRRWGIGCPHTEESKKLISDAKKGLKQTPQHIQKRVDSMTGFKQSQHQKNTARETFECAWLVTNPQGQSFNIINLRKFCRENNLNQGNMVKVSTGILKQHKGWKCVKIGS